MDPQAHEGLEALHEPLHGVEAQHCAGSECGEWKFSFGAHVQISNEASRNKKPGGLRPTGSCETQEAEPPGVKGSKKAIRREKSTAKPPQPGGSSMRLA